MAAPHCLPTGGVTVLLFGVLMILQCFADSPRCPAKPTSLSTPAVSTDFIETRDARLPLSLRPSHYSLILEPSLQPPWSIKGELMLTMDVLQSTSNITLNMLDIITFNETVKVSMWTKEQPEKPLQVLRQTYDAHRQMYTAELGQQLPAGAHCNFSMQYEGLLNDKLVGFYRSKYITEDGNDTWLATTQFSPTDARRAFPGFDEPGFKSTFDITLVHPSNYSAHSNMPPVSTKDRRDGKVITTFATTPVMSTFIIAFHISNLKSLPVKQLNGINFTVWSRPEVLSQASYSYNVAPKMLQYFEDYFGIDYALPKLDMVAIPDFKFSAMENWGFITSRETVLLIEPEASPRDHFSAAEIVGHEIAHQWFGNLVTPIWWSELWLKEAFASFMSNLALDHVEPSWNAMEKFVTRVVHSAMALDSLVSSHPINVPVNHPDEIGEIFDEISYKKGASILHMVYRFIGPQAFKSGLSNYLQQLQYSSADQYDLWRHLTATGNTSLPRGAAVETIMVTWTHKQGYPVVNVTRTNDTIQLTQEQFLLGAHNASAAWWIPITYTTAAAPDFNSSLPTAWMPDDRHQILDINVLTKPNEWIVLNLNASGFYRVNYEAKDWQLLVDQMLLNHNVFPPAQRAALLDDAFNLAREGYVNYSIAMEMTLYLKMERHIVPWEAAFRSLTSFYTIFNQDRIFGDLKAYMLRLVSSWYETLGFSDDTSASYPERSARELAVKWACRLRHANCVAQARRLFRDWINGNLTSISGIVRYPVLSVGVAEADDDTWERILDRALQAAPAERIHLLFALANTRSVWLLNRYLWLSIDADSGIRKHEMPSIVAAVSSQPAGRDLAWRFVSDNWRRIVLYLGSSNRSLAKLLKSTTKSFSSKRAMTELEQFQLAEAGRLGAGERAVNQQIEEVRTNIAWWNNHYSTITQWLRHRT